VDKALVAEGQTIDISLKVANSGSVAGDEVVQLYVRDEFEIMKTHSINGFKLLSKSNKPLFRDSAIVALQHHERFDGKGYPNGFSGEQIHIFARIVGLVDVYDALTNKRVYKDAWSPEQARDYIAEQRGRQFDPDIVDVFLESFEEIKSISRIYNDSYMLV
ncbi:MAG: HD domain-containing protein, partial [Clostridiales bacterium]|nr:HD domain-containing protein [Clostridiales bacterium]